MCTSSIFLTTKGLIYRQIFIPNVQEVGLGLYFLKISILLCIEEPTCSTNQQRLFKVLLFVQTVSIEQILLNYFCLFSCKNNQHLIGLETLRLLEIRLQHRDNTMGNQPRVLYRWIRKCVRFEKSGTCFRYSIQNQVEGLLQ